MTHMRQRKHCSTHTPPPQNQPLWKSAMLRRSRKRKSWPAAARLPQLLQHSAERLLLLCRQRQGIHLFGVADALGCGAEAPMLRLPAPLRVEDGEAQVGAICGASDLRKGVPRLQVLRVSHPSGLVADLLGHYEITHGCLEDHVEADVSGWPLRLLRLLGGLHKLRGPRDRLVLLVREVACGALRRALHAAGEDHPDPLFAVMLLDGAHLQTANLVDPELGAVLRGLAEDWRHCLEHLLQPGTVVHAGVQLTGHLAIRDAGGRDPGGREERTGGFPLEGSAEEVLLLPLADCLLLGDQGPQRLDVLRRGVRRHEEVAVHSPVREDRVEQPPEQTNILHIERLRRTVKTAEEGTACGKRGHAVSRPLGRRQVEGVKVEVHTTRNARNGHRRSIRETFLPAGEQAAGQGCA
mmetsp:Transcript_62105/g.192399  ORF Transcript_62105/g.192399 Transcript_62105/m.192399 type:complete len:409 (-) Transcript_62105:333-1559(-)